MLKIGDYVVIFIILLLSVVSFVWVYNEKNTSGNQLVADITVDGKVISSVSLENKSTSNLIVPEGYPGVEIEIKDGKIRIKESDCPDRVCVRTGWLSHNGDTSICVPYKIIVKIKSVDIDVDAVAF